jgi:hypothetical protein
MGSTAATSTPATLAAPTVGSYSLLPPTDANSWYYYCYSLFSSILGRLSIAVEFNSVGDVFFFWWKVFMSCVLCTFALSCISQFAQYYKMTLDQEASDKLRSRLPLHIVKLLKSPTSGRLNLPPPTATKAKGVVKARVKRINSNPDDGEHVADNTHHNRSY